MLWRYRKNVNRSDVIGGRSDEAFNNYFKFLFFCILLIVPVYAITNSVINQNWIMVIIDVLLVPVGFVHGLLLLLGIVN